MDRAGKKWIPFNVGLVMLLLRLNSIYCNIDTGLTAGVVLPVTTSPSGRQLDIEYLYVPDNCEDSYIEDAGLIAPDETFDPYNKDHLEARNRNDAMKAKGKSRLGDKISIHYTGFIDENSETGSPGSLVDTTYNYFKREHRQDIHGHKHSNRPGRPFEFTLGEDEGHKVALKAFEQGLVGMCVGERRQLIIPPELGFGFVDSVVKRSHPPVPAGATLRYVVQLVSIKRPAKREVQLGGEGDGDVSPEMEDAYQKMLEGPVVGKNVFAEIDLNKDGKISHEEMEAWFYRQHSKILEDGEPDFVDHPEGVDPNAGWTGSSQELKRRKSRKRRGPERMPQHFWESQDRDKDGYISWKEFPGPKGTKEDPFKSDL